MENSRRLEQRPASQADTIAFRDVNASLQHSSNGGGSLGTPQTPQKAAHSSSLRTPLSMMTGNMRQDHHLSAAYNGITTSRPRETDRPDWLSTSNLPGPMTPGASKAYELNLTGPARHSILRAETQLTTTSAGAATAVSASARASAISTLSVPASPAVAAIATSNQDSAVQDSAEILASATQQHEVAHTDSFCSSFYAPSASDNTSIAVNVESQLAGTPASLSSCQCEVLGQSDGDEGMDSKTSPACKNQANVRQGSPAASHGHDFLEENDMQRRLLDMDSSFLPEPSLILSATDQSHGADDTYVNGVEDESFSDDRDPISVRRFGSAHNSQQQQQQQHQQQRPSPSPRPETGKTEDSTTILVDRPMNDHGHDESGSDEAPSNKHTETADSDHAISPSPPANGAESLAFRESPGTSQRVTSGSHQHSAPKVPLLNVTNASKRTDDSPRLASPDTSLRRRPKLLQDRQASNRLSMSSTTTDGTTPGDLSTPFDLVMQSGGVAPVTPSGSRLHKRSRSRNEMSRTTSLGSIASSISGFSDDHLMPSKRDLTGLSESSFNLQTLDEEREKENELSKPELSNLGEKKDQLRNSSNTASPSGKNQNILGSNKDSLKSSGSLESKLHEGLTLSPHVSSAKRNTSGAGFPRTGKALTLKEQSSTIDRLSKENFDLKMRIHFLSEALDRRSEEGIKEMISENVELNSAKLRLQKDNQALRKKQKELEAALKEKESGQEGEKGDNQEHEQEFEEADRGADDEELLYLRERIDTYEDEIERLRNESIMRESERRRLAEIVKAIGNDKGAMSSDAGAREERDMWKDMLGAETAAREQAEDENKRLRYEILRLKGEPTSARGSRLGTQSVLSRSTILDRESTRNSRHGKMTADQNSDATAEIELLRQENAELRREVSAQTSMLTSRNREKERLYQEIEELKLHQRRDGNRSIGDDSILERSISRTGRDRAMSRTSGDRPKSSQTPPHFTDAERESLETKNGELRDQVSALKIENQNSRAQFEQLVAQMESYEQGYQADMQSAEEEMQALIQERDQAYASVEEHEIALQDLRNEAQDEIDALGDELEEKYDECERLETELRNQQENLEALQAEIRSANEGINRLEEDAQANLQKYKNVQAELDDANRELESLEKSLYEANRKVETLTVQQESSQNEIAFLREEQESDKIRIGDFEAELKTCQIDYQSERDRARELEIRLIEEREQREAIDNQEKQEVQRAMNELNRELSTTKDEARKLKKSLSAAQLEATTWKERLFELEQSLRETLGDLTGSRSSLIMSITKIQRELEQTALELENTRANLDEKETLLRNRDALLESHALETRKLADLLDRERQAHRADKHSFEQALKSHQQASRTITQNNSRITDLEAARSQERRRFGILEQQFKDQLAERNAMFLTIWKRLSSMCGPDWAHSNSLINGNLPSQEVIGNMLFWPGFSKNLLLSVKTVENMLNNFKSQIKAIERELSRQYQTLEHNLALRFKKLERLEEAATTIKIQMNQQQNHKSRASIPGAGTSSASHETKQLKSEIKFLRAELNLSESRNKRRSTAGTPGHVSKHSASTVVAGPYTSSGLNSGSSVGTSTGAITPEPSHTSPDAAIFAQPSNRGGGSQVSGDTSSQRWIERLQDLERRLKAEREARLIDRDGARRRLQESNATNEELKAQLEKQQPLHDYDQDGYQHRSRQGELNMLDRAVITSSRASRIRNEDAMDGRGRPAYENDLRNKHTSSSRRRHNSRDYRAKLDYDDTNDGPGSTIEG